MHEASSGHRYSCAFGFGQREPQVLGGERHGHSQRAVLLVDNLAAVSLVHPGIKQRIRQDIVSEVAIDPAVVTSVSKMSVWLGNSMPLARWLGPT